MPESDHTLIVERGGAGVSSPEVRDIPLSQEDWTVIPEKLLLVPVVKRPQDEDSPLKRWMDAHGCSLWFIASRVGVSKRAVQLWYTGRCVPELAPAFKLAAITASYCHEQGCHTTCVRADSWLGTRVGRAHWKAMEKAEGRKGKNVRDSKVKTLEKEKVA